jgi:magnesium transporter
MWEEKAGGDAAPPGPDLEAGVAGEAEIRADVPGGLEDELPVDLAGIIENLSLAEQVSIVRNLSVEQAAEALVEMDESARVELLENLAPEEAASLVGEMSPDDAADILDELEEEHRDVLLNNLETEDAEEIRGLMAFDPETAGGLMNTEVVILRTFLTADEGIRQLRRDMEDKEIPYYAYVVGAEGRLDGVLSLRDLMLAPKGAVLGEMLRDKQVISVNCGADRSEVAHLFGDYNFMALPVVDARKRLLGVITHDDVFDMLHELASEDMLGMVGAGQDESVSTPWLESVKMRLPWLVVNMLNSSISAFVVYMFEGSIAALPVLAVLMPMVANQAGNTGQQALAVIIRQLALEKLDGKNAVQAVRREAKISLLNGLLLAALVFLGVFCLTGNSKLSLLLVGALVMDMFLGAIAGASIPLLLKKMGRDPAQASSIFLTAITDSAGFFIFLGLSTLFILS